MTQAQLTLLQYQANDKLVEDHEAKCYANEGETLAEYANRIMATLDTKDLV